MKQINEYFYLLSKNMFIFKCIRFFDFFFILLIYYESVSEIFTLSVFIGLITV